MRLEGSAPLNGATLGGGRLDGQPRTQGKVTFSTGGDLIRTKLETPARSATVVTRQGWVSKQSWGDTATADGPCTGETRKPGCPHSTTISDGAHVGGAAEAPPFKPGQPFSLLAEGTRPSCEPMAKKSRPPKPAKQASSRGSLLYAAAAAVVAIAVALYYMRRGEEKPVAMERSIATGFSSPRRI